MSGKGKKRNENAYRYSLLVASNIINETSDFIYVENFSNDSFNNSCEEKIICIVSKSNPETETIKKQSFEKLSLEAKQVIKLIVDTPLEFLQEGIKLTTKNTIKRYIIKNMHWKQRLIDNVFKEIYVFLNGKE